ncbi:hypothetical protein Tco_0332338 [Tanacetum coccineum]
MCPDGMIKRCVHGPETRKILDECHYGPTGGHYGPSITAKKISMLVFIGQQYSKKLILSFKIVMPARDLKEFKSGENVLLFNSKYKFKTPKLITKWYGPFMVKHGYPYGYVELYDKHGGSSIVNEQHVKLYHDKDQFNELSNEEISLMCE